jgi:hypothetical protein
MRGGRLSQRHLLAGLISVLRIAVEDCPGVLMPDVVSRLRYLGHGDGGGSRPRDAYSSGIAEALRAAARAQVAEARQRIALGDDVPPPLPGVAEVRPPMRIIKEIADVPADHVQREDAQLAILSGDRVGELLTVAALRER